MSQIQAPLQTLRPLLAALLVAIPSLCSAQSAGPLAPDAGAILRQVQPSLVLPPVSSAPALTIDKDKAATRPAGEAFPVSLIRITGNKKIGTETLHALVSEGEGKSLTLGQLETLVERITDYYRSHGYPLTRAVIPAQTINGGVVNVQILVARYGKVSLINHSRFGDALLQGTISPLAPGDDIEQQSLDKALLLLSDISGLVVNARVKPGDEVGTSDLEVFTTSAASATGSAALDNYGNRFTGRTRASTSVNIVDPLNLKFSNVVSFSALSSGAGMNYGRIGYESVVNGLGSRLSASYSALRYKLGGALASLDAHGTARVMSLVGKQPFLRSQDANIFGQIQYDRLQLQDRIGVSGTSTDRHLNNWTVGFSGDTRDTLFTSGINSWSLSRTSGNVGFNNTVAQFNDAGSGKTEGGFARWNANLSRLQSLGNNDDLYLAVSRQWSNKNLDSSQKMAAGGSYSVRAYDTGAISGDSGYQATIEFRHDLGLIGEGKWQAVAFVDGANVTVNAKPWIAASNSAALGGVGVGLNWSGVNSWNAKAYLAKPVGTAPDLVATTNSARTWLEINKGF